MTQKTKLFINKKSQICQDKETDNVILSQKPTTWNDFLAAMNEANILADFLSSKERRQKRQHRDLFKGWREKNTTQAWQVKAIEKSVKKANSKKAKFIEHQKVVNWLNSWGNDQEQESLHYSLSN